MKKTGINGYVYEFSFDYRHINKTDITNNIPVIHRHFMLKYGIV